jgi:hypothetical protein
MPHILLNRQHINNDTRFQTASAILNVTPYPSKVLIIGTYNEENIEDNEADFFYGRNFFWPVIYNIKNNENILNQRRDRGETPWENPSLTQILELCISLQLSFADLITDVHIQLPNHQDKYLDRAIGNNQTTNNNTNIIEYINQHRSITHVYATTKFSGYRNLNQLWESLKIGVREGVIFGSILTPSGMGGIPNLGGLGRAATIARYWVWANHINNPYGEFKNETGYTHLNHNWLTECDINPAIF